jgi:hypothetical protein
MSTTKSQRRRLLLLLGAFLLLAGATTATTLALRPHGHPVAAPKRETTTVRAVSYPATSLPDDVRDGVLPAPFGPACSPGGGTCIAGESNARTGGAHFAMSVDHGKTWVMGSLPGRQVPPGSFRQWWPPVTACVRGECAILRTAFVVPHAESAIWTCTVVGGRVACVRHDVPLSKSPSVAGISCISDTTCFADGLPAGDAHTAPTDLALWAFDPATGHLGRMVGLPGGAETGGDCPIAHRARDTCVNTGAQSFGGELLGLRCSLSGCAVFDGQSEIVWRRPSVEHPVAPVDVVVRDTSLGGAHLPAPIGVRPSGPTSRETAVCDLTTWCVTNAAADGNGDFAWELESTGGTQTGLGVGEEHPVPLRVAWVVLHPSGQWSVSAHRPAGAGNVQVGGGVEARGRWCGAKFCVVLHIQPPASFSVQRVPRRSATGTESGRAR